MSKLRRIAHLVQSSPRLRTSGQSMVEYALIATLLALVVGGALAATGPAIGNIFSNVIYNVVQGQTTPYNTLRPTEFSGYASKVAVYQEPTQAGPNGSGNGGGGAAGSATALVVQGSATAYHSTLQITSTQATATAAAKTATNLALTTSSTPTPTSGGSALPTSDATPSATGTPTKTGTPTVTSTASISPTPFTATLPLAEQFDNTASVGDWQITPNGWSIGSGQGRNLSSALTYAPGGATSAGNSATFVPLLNLNSGSCPGAKPVIQFWSRWNLVDNITLILEAGNYSGVSSVTWTTVWSYNYNQTNQLYTTGNYNVNLAWRRYQVDISSLACQPGMTTAFRFRVNPGGLTTVNSFWNTDDVAIYDNNQTNQSFNISNSAGNSSACDSSQVCNRSSINVTNGSLCDALNYCGTNGTSVIQTAFYQGGDWRQTLNSFNGNPVWEAKGFNSPAEYKNPSDDIFQIAQPIDLTGISAAAGAPNQPVLDFWTQYLTPVGHTLNVEEMPASQASSLNQTWTAIGTVFGSPSTWTHYSIDLKPYDGQTIMLRFRIGALNSAYQAGQNWMLSETFVGIRMNLPNLGTIPLPFNENFQNLTYWKTNGSSTDWQIDSTSRAAYNYNFDPRVLGTGSDTSWAASFYHYQTSDPAGPSAYVAGGAWVAPTAAKYCGVTTTCVGYDLGISGLGISEPQVQLTSNATSITGASGALSLPSTWTTPANGNQANAGENFAATFTRKYVISTAGTYYFMLYSTQGSRFKIGPALASTVTVAPDTTGGYPFNSDVSTDWNPSSTGPTLEFYKKVLAAGTYYFEIDYFQTTYTSSNPPVLQFLIASPVSMLHSNAAGSDYTAAVDTTITLNGTIGITTIPGQDVYMNFQTRLENGTTFTNSGDGMYVEVSPDGGTTWVTLDGNQTQYTANDADPVSLNNPWYPSPVFGNYFNSLRPNYNTPYDDSANGVPKPATFRAWHTFKIDLDTAFGATPTQLMIRFELDSRFSNSPAPGFYIANVHVCQAVAPLAGLCP